MAKIKVLLDTDIGTDADDAVCLSYLLSEPRCDLVGVTTVGREPDKRAEMVDALCALQDQPDVPIAAGAGRPFFASLYWWHHRPHQASILEQWPARQGYAPNQSVDLMRRVIRDNPGEVVLLSVGPMTNVALLAAVDPEAVQQLHSVYSMIGRMQFQGDELMEECNTMLDPVAAGAAFQRNLPVHRIAGLNVTRGHALTKEQVSAAFTGDRLGGLRGCCGIWADRNQTGKVGLHDPLTATLIFNPDFAEYRRGRIGVKLFDHDRNERFPFTDDQHTGATYFEPDPEGPHEMASRFDSDAMIEHIVRTIGGEEAVSTMASAG